MYEDSKTGMQCAECEALLAEALDGTLHGSTLAAFEAHQQSCPACHAMMQEASLGMHWLKGLDEIEPPRNLMHNILAQTIGTIVTEQVEARPVESWSDKLRERIAGFFGPVATPRFAMSFGMAFFSITMLLNIAGFHFGDFRRVDLSSRAIVKTYYATQARAIRYYENIRLVYEIESRVRDLKSAATKTDKQQEDNNTSKKPKDTSQYKQQELQKDSHVTEQPTLAASTADQEVRMNQARLNRSES